MSLISGSNMDENANPMKDFYRNKVVFLTGGTGFLGQLFIDKLLRSDVKCLYILIRPRKGTAPIERLKSLLSGQVFAKLVRYDRNYFKRIRTIEGDLNDANLGVSDEILREIQENVEIMLHCAADIRFNENLLNFIISNLRGTREVLRVSEKIKKLQMFCYISTAYSNCYLKECDEKFYDPPVDPEVMIEHAEKANDPSNPNPEFMYLSDLIIKPWPNGYTYSKSLTEDLIRKFAKTLPVCIIRPSIIISTYEDPLPGWTSNIASLSGFMIAVGLGISRTMCMYKELVGDIVCADFVINSTLATIWYTHKEKLLNKNIEPKIVHVSTSHDAPITWGEIINEPYKRCLEQPPSKIIWIPYLEITTSLLKWKFLIFWYHFIPALIADNVLSLLGKKERLLPLYRQLQKSLLTITYFTGNQWMFNNKNMREIWDAMTPADKEFYPSSVQNFNFTHYSYNYVKGLKRYLMKESMENVELGRKIYRKFLVLHYLLLTFCSMILLTGLYLIVRFFNVYPNVTNSFVNFCEFIKNPN